LQIWDQNGEIVSLYGRHMYEHHLPSSANALTMVCGEDALGLLIELLEEADASADHDCVEDAVDRVPPERKGRQHRQQAEDDNGQQDRR